jgi:hypothetical protein
LTSVSVLSPGSAQGRYYAPPIKIFSPTQYNITATLSIAIYYDAIYYNLGFPSSPEGCFLSAQDGINYTNTIVMTVFGGCDGSIKAIRALSVGAIGLIIQNLDNGT